MLENRRMLRVIRVKFPLLSHSSDANISICFHLSYRLTKCKSTIRGALSFIATLVIPVPNVKHNSRSNQEH